MPRLLGGPTPTSWSPASAAARTRRGPSPASSTPPARLVGVEAAGGAAITNGIPGVLHGMRSRLLQDEAGQILEAQSISAGLDYPGIGPEHAHLAAIGRADTPRPADDEVLDAFRLLARPRASSPRSSRPTPWPGWPQAGTDALPAGSTVLITLSGRGDKDVAQVREIFGRQTRCLTSRRSSGPAATQGRKLLIPYLMGGMTDDWTQSLAAVVAAGADAVEVGIPFSDPMMDGPVIQEAALRALQRGTVPDQVLDGIAAGGGAGADGRHDLLQPGLPGRAPAHGPLPGRRRRRRGAIVADLPLEELDPWAAEADAAGVDTVLLVAPSSPPERVERICARAAGFVYAVARMGVTGERVDLGSDVAKVVERIRSCTDMPVCVGVGRVDAGAGGRGVRGGRRGGGRLGPGAPPARGARAPMGGGLRRVVPRRHRLARPRELPLHGGRQGALSRRGRVRGAPHVVLQVPLGRQGGRASGRRRTAAPWSTSVPVHALAARMRSASAARVASGTGSPENTQGSAVQIP